MGIHSSHILGIVWINKKNLSKPMSGKDLGIPIYFPWNGEKALTFFQKTDSLGTIWFSTEYFHDMGICTFPDYSDCISFYQI